MRAARKEGRIHNQPSFTSLPPILSFDAIAFSAAGYAVIPCSASSVPSTALAKNPKFVSAVW